MSKSAVKAKKKARKEKNAVKKSKSKRLLLVGVCALVVICVAAFFIYSSAFKNKNETYSDGGQRVQLFADGRFDASLAHYNRKTGTYIKSSESGRIKIIFNVDGKESTGWIVDDVLSFPKEWEDGHDHGNQLRKR